MRVLTIFAYGENGAVRRRFLAVTVKPACGVLLRPLRGLSVVRNVPIFLFR